MIATAIVMGCLAIYFLGGREAIDPKLAKERAELQKKIEEEKNMTQRGIFCSKELLKLENLEDVGKIKLLLDHGGDIDTNNTGGGTFPLLEAARSGYAKSVTELLKAKADKNKTDNKFRTALYVACENQHLEVVKILLQAKVKTNTKVLNETTPLGVTVSLGNEEILKALLQAGEDANTRPYTNRKWTLLHEACDKEHVGIVKILIEEQARIDVCDNALYTPLDIACEKGNFEIVESLIKKGAEINKDTRVYSLNVACEKGDLEIVDFLIKKGAKIDDFDKDLYTPLHVASEENNLEMVKFLVNSIVDKDKKKAYIRQKNVNHNTALDLAGGDIKTFLEGVLAS